MWMGMAVNVCAHSRSRSQHCALRKWWMLVVVVEVVVVIVVDSKNDVGGSSSSGGEVALGRFPRW